MRKLRTLKRVRSFFSVIMQEKHGTMRARKARTANLCRSLLSFDRNTQLPDKSSKGTNDPTDLTLYTE